MSRSSSPDQATPVQDIQHLSDADWDRIEKKMKARSYDPHVYRNGKRTGLLEVPMEYTMDVSVSAFTHKPWKDLPLILKELQRRKHEEEEEEEEEK